MALELSENVLWHGVDAPPQQPEWLVAGPLCMGLADGELRGIAFNSREIVRRVYGAVRDRYFNTVPGVLSELRVERGSGFRVSFLSTHISDEVDFAWRGEISGEPDGSVRFEFDGAARRAMQKNRIGFCVLLPLSLAGTSCRVEYVSGDRAEAAFPVLVDPMQPLRGLHDFRELRYDAGPGVELVMGFEGDVFEIEDQRNWTDASYKIYCTPQRIPMPASMAKGQRVRQVVTFRLTGKTADLPSAVPRAEEEVVVVEWGESCGKLPETGVEMASHEEPLTVRDLARLRALRLAHYRVLVDFSIAGWKGVLERGLTEAAAMGAAVEAVLVLSEDGAVEARAAAEVAARHQGRVVRWLIMTRDAPASQDRSLAEAREVLKPAGAPVGGGTNADFFQLNSHRPETELMDFVSVPVRPCAHRFDDATLAENLEGQRAVLGTMAALWPGMPRMVSPVSLRTRAQKGPAPGAGEMPAQADVRQMSLLGAAWTVGCIKAAAESGAAGLTLYQTTGLRGIMEREAGSEAPAHFHSVPGGVFPIYLVLAALADWRNAKVVETQSDAPLAAEALVLEKAGRCRALVANYTSLPRRVMLKKAGRAAFVRASAVVLDADTTLAAMTDPEAWLKSPPRREMQDGAVVLPAFAVAWLDLAWEKLSVPAGAGDELADIA